MGVDVGSIGPGKRAPVGERSPLEEAHDAVARGHGDVGPRPDGHGTAPTDPRVDPTLDAFAAPKHAQDPLLGEGVHRVVVGKFILGRIPVGVVDPGVRRRRRERRRSADLVLLGRLSRHHRRAHGDPGVRRVTTDVRILGPALDQPKHGALVGDVVGTRQFAILGVKLELVVRTALGVHGPHLEVRRPRRHERGAGGSDERRGSKKAGGVARAKVSSEARRVAPVPERHVPVVVRSQRQHPRVVARAERDGLDAVPVPSQNGERGAGVDVPDDGGWLVASFAGGDEGSGAGGEGDARERLAAAGARAAR